MVGSAQADIDAQGIAAGCHALVLEARGQQQSSEKVESMGECLGAVAGVGQALIRIHGHFRAYFPNLTYPIPDKIVNAYFATSVLLGPDVCFPKQGVPLGTLATAVDRYAQSKPPKAGDDMFQFVSLAISYAYGCGPHNPNPP
jgi:hypothetical protein